MGTDEQPSFRDDPSRKGSQLWPAAPGDKTQEFAAFARSLQSARTAQQTLQKMVDLAPATIPGCEHAGVSMVTGAVFSTPAASSDVPRAVDRIQYESGQGPCLDAIRHHDIFVTDDLAAEARWPQFSARAAATTGVHSMLSFRLFVEEDTLGSLNLYSTKIGAFGPDSRAAGAVFAAHAAVAVTTAREHDRVEKLQHDLASSERHLAAYEQQAQAALMLQRSMLPALPAAAFTLAARYVPAVAAAQLGGDWYDAFSIPDAGMALVVGDVAGHDMAAAVQMSQLRNLLRGAAVDGPAPPGEVLRRLDRIASRLQLTSTATCIYGVLDHPADGEWRLTYANAGHPPPLLITPGHDARFLDGQGDHLMLGLDLDRPRTSSTADLPVGATLLMYTDGLIERRGHSITNGLNDLRAFAQTLATEPLESALDQLTDRYAAAPDDDVCILALRISD